jgi:hypothetical protein
MAKKKEPRAEVIAAGAAGFVGGAIVGKYLIDEILSDEDIKDWIEVESEVIYKCPSCKNVLKFGDNYCSNCAQALQWKKKKK